MVGSSNSINSLSHRLGSGARPTKEREKREGEERFIALRNLYFTCFFFEGERTQREGKRKERREKKHEEPYIFPPPPIYEDDHQVQVGEERRKGK